MAETHVVTDPVEHCPRCGAAFDEDAVRRDERQRMAKLLQDHAEAITAFTGDDSSTLKLVVYMLRLG